MNKMQKIKINVIVKAFEESAKNPKNAPTDNAIIEMLENTALEFLQVEQTRGGALYNRGSVVECITRYTINEYVRGQASAYYKKSVKDLDINLVKCSKDLLNDLNLKNQDYEIKLITPLARASMSSIIKTDVIIIDLRAKTRGAWLVSPNDLVIYKGSSIKDFQNGIKLDLLTELLGLE